MRWSAILLVVLFSAALRFHHLDLESLFMDEIHQVSYYQDSFSAQIRNAAKQQQPPLDYWIGHLISKVSNSDFAVRLPAALFGIASVLLLMLIVERMTTLPIALATGVFAALLPFHVYFSQHARPYSIAIFFFLAVLFMLERLLNQRRSMLTAVVFFTVMLCFLYTRALVPLVVAVSIILIAALLVLVAVVRKWRHPESLVKRLFLIIITSVAAIAAYMPVFLNILNIGGRYTRSKSGTDVMDILTNWHRFDLSPLYRAFVTQLEPIGYVLLVVMALSLVLTLRKTFITRHVQYVFYAGLLFVAGLLHVLIFQAATNFVFRPPYAIYLFPLALVICAVGVSEGMKRAPERIKPKLSLGVVVAAMMLITYTAYTLIDFKTLRKVTDWRALTQILLQKDQRTSLFVFDGINRHGVWEPVFYGVPRYSNMKLRGTTVAQVPENINRIVRSKLSPVFVLFHYRDYFLSRQSRYSFHPKPEHEPELDFSKLERSTRLSVRKLTGLHVIELRDSNGYLAQDMLSILDEIIRELPESSALVEPHIAAAYLRKALQEPGYEYHVEKAISLAPNNKVTQVRGRLENLKNIRPIDKPDQENRR